MRNIILAALVLFVTGCDENGAIIVGEPITVAPVETDTEVEVVEETDSVVETEDSDSDDVVIESDTEETDLEDCDPTLFDDIYGDMALDSNYENEDLKDCVLSEGMVNTDWCDKAISILECWTGKSHDDNRNGRELDTIGSSGSFTIRCADVEAVRADVRACGLTLGIPR